MLTNAEILAELNAAIKGITVSGDLGATILEPEQFDRFVRQMMFKTVVLPRYRYQKMNSPKVDIDRIAFGSQIMGPPPTEGQPVAEADFVSPSFAQHQLEAAEMRGVVSLTDSLLRRNIERGGLKNTVLDMMGQRAGLDIEDQAINGDTALPADTKRNKLLRLNEGWLKLTRRYVAESADAAYDDVSTSSFSTGVGETEAVVWYDKVPITEGSFEIYTTSTSGTLVADEDGDGVIDEVGGSGIGGVIDYESGKITLTGLTASTDYFVKYTAETFDKSADGWVEVMFDLLIKVLPKEYFGSPGEWEINVPWYVLKLYRDVLKSRGTSLGDMFQTQGSGKIRVPYEDVWIQYVPNMPKNKVWLTHPDNTIYGVFHEVEVEQEREAKAKRTDIIIDAETDYQFEEPEATVVGVIY